jgi:ATP-binding cassette subfamily B protein
MKSLSYLNKYLWKYKWRLLLGVLFIIGSNYFLVATVESFGSTTDILTNWKDYNYPDDQVLWFALTAGGEFMLYGLISGVFLFFTRQTIIIVSRYIEFDLKNEIYAQYQRLGYTFFKKNSTGDLMNRIAEDVSHVRMYLGPGIMYTVNLFFLAIFVVSSMLSINAWMTLIVLLPLPLMSLIIYKVASKINRISTTVQQEQSAMSTLVQETFAGIRVVKAYGRAQESGARFGDSAEQYKQKSMRLVLVNSLFMPTIFILIGVSTILCIYTGGILTYQGMIKTGEIVMFIIFVNKLTWPFASIGWVTSLVQRADASQARINEFLMEQPEIVNPHTGDFAFSGRIEFRNVSYTYRNSGIQAIQNLSFLLEPGETLGIVGRTGSGKSTILNLLMRQIDPDEGEILIDGVNLREINLEAFRDQTGIVPQDVFLFSDTIRNNLQFGQHLPTVSEEALQAVCEAAHVYHNVREFPDGFDTLLGERGVNLSGGQKQRLSIARALIRKPQLLILDDCLSAVDTETEEIILAHLSAIPLKAGVVVSHRISSIRNASKIIVIREGELSEEGSHEELLELNGEYAEMYHRQLSEEAA